jgi:hypothetical protein
MTDDLQHAAVPGFTPEQSWALDVVAERAAQRAVDKLRLGPCPVTCARMEAVDRFCFGKAEDGIAGVDTRLPAQEAAVARLTDSILWLQRIVVGAIVSGAVAFGVWLLERHAG